MISLRFLFRFCFFWLWSLLPHRVIAQGQLALYVDFSCRTPSQLEPSVSLPLSTCLVPIGAVGVAIKLLPACESGTASMIMFQDTSCSRSTYSISNSYTGWTDGSNCFYLYILKSVPGIMFTCDEPATNPQATSTSTITASVIAGVATNAPSSSSSTKTTTTSRTSSSTSTTSTSPSNANDSSTQSGDSNTGSSGLSLSDKIAIGVGVGVGIPSICIALLAWCCPFHRK